MFGKADRTWTVLAIVAAVGSTSLMTSAARAECGCAVGQERNRLSVAQAHVLLPQNTKKSIVETQTETYHAPNCWAITDFDVAQHVLGTMGSVSWSFFPAGINMINTSGFENAHQQALDGLISAGYQGQNLVNAQAQLNESFSNMMSEYGQLQSSHGGVSITATTSGRGRLTWKGRERARATLNVTETCVPAGFKSIEGVKSLIINNANLPPVGNGNGVGSGDSNGTSRPVVKRDVGKAILSTPIRPAPVLRKK